MQLIDERKFFTLQSGRQTGKTTSARWLARHYNEGDRYRAIWVDIQTAREEPDPTAAFRTVIENLDFGVETWLGDVGVPPPSARSLENPTTVVLRYLRDLAARCPRPLVVLIDEADGLVGPAMVSFLTQLRQGYLARSDAPFPHSVALIGARAVRDYIFTHEDRRAVSWLGTTSPFNIAAEATTLGAFTRDEVEELLLQHTTTTGQRFEPEAIAAIYHLSQGRQRPRRPRCGARSARPQRACHPGARRGRQGGDHRRTAHAHRLPGSEAPRAAGAADPRSDDRGRANPG
jgi:hypothetical protein